MVICCPPKYKQKENAFQTISYKMDNSTPQLMNITVCGMENSTKFENFRRDPAAENDRGDEGDREERIPEDRARNYTPSQAALPVFHDAGRLLLGVRDDPLEGVLPPQRSTGYATSRGLCMFFHSLPFASNEKKHRI